VQLAWIALIGIGAAVVVSLCTPIAIKAGRALQLRIQGPDPEEQKPLRRVASIGH
jgi:hypothetical protein